MRRFFVVLMALAMVAGFAGVSLATIEGSSHDLSSASLGTNELCKFCHAPHNTTTTNGGPLWNHTVTTQTFTLYGGGTASASGISALCLSCHDGQTAINAFGNRDAGATDTTIQVFNASTSANIGLDLSNDHPVMVAYGASTDFNDSAGLSLAKVFSGNVECASCHNVHEQSPAAGTGYFLRASNAGSQLCLDCHKK